MENQTPETPKTDEQIVEAAEKVMDEALLPELSNHHFTFKTDDVTMRIQLKPLRVKYQKLFSKELEPLAASLGFDISTSNWAGALSSCLSHPEVLPKLIQVLAANDGKPITDEMMDDSEMQPEEMAQALLMFAEKNKAIGKPIADFFTAVLPVVQKKFLAELDNIKTALLSSDTTTTV
jgi:hypothetical protein